MATCTVASVSTWRTPTTRSHLPVISRWSPVRDATVTGRVTSPGPRLHPSPGDFRLPPVTVCQPGLVSTSIMVTMSHQCQWVTRVIMSHQWISDGRLWLPAWTGEYMYFGYHESPGSSWITRDSMSHQWISDCRLWPSASLDWWVHVLWSPQVTMVSMSSHEISDCCLPGLVSTCIIVTMSHQVTLSNHEISGCCLPGLVSTYTVTMSHPCHHESPGSPWVTMGFLPVAFLDWWVYVLSPWVSRVIMSRQSHQGISGRTPMITFYGHTQ